MLNANFLCTNTPLKSLSIQLYDTGSPSLPDPSPIKLTADFYESHRCCMLWLGVRTSAATTEGLMYLILLGPPCFYQQIAGVVAILDHCSSASCNNFRVIKCDFPGVQARACSSSVDLVTLLSILPMSYVDRHSATVAEANIESDRKNWAWCTNPKCQKVIHRRGLRPTGKNYKKT